MNNPHAFLNSQFFPRRSFRISSHKEMLSKNQSPRGGFGSTDFSLWAFVPAARLDQAKIKPRSTENPQTQVCATGGWPTLRAFPGDERARLDDSTRVRQ